MGGGGDFTVIVTRKEVVTGGLPMLLHLLPLSNLDLVMPPVYVSVFFCYKKPIRVLMEVMASPLGPWLGF